MAQCLEHQPVHRRVMGQIPIKGAYLVAGPGTHAGANQLMCLSHISVSLSLPLSTLPPTFSGEKKKMGKKIELIFVGINLYLGLLILLVLSF